MSIEEIIQENKEFFEKNKDLIINHYQNVAPLIAKYNTPQGSVGGIKTAIRSGALRRSINDGFTMRLIRNWNRKPIFFKSYKQMIFYVANVGNTFYSSLPIWDDLYSKNRKIVGYTLGIDMDIKSENISQGIINKGLAVVKIILKEYLSGCLDAVNLMLGKGFHILIHHSLLKGFNHEEYLKLASSFNDYIRTIDSHMRKNWNKLKRKYNVKIDNLNFMKLDALNDKERVFKCPYTLHQDLNFIIVPIPIHSKGDELKISVNFDDARLENFRLENFPGETLYSRKPSGEKFETQRKWFLSKLAFNYTFKSLFNGLKNINMGKTKGIKRISESGDPKEVEVSEWEGDFDLTNPELIMKVEGIWCRYPKDITPKGTKTYRFGIPVQANVPIPLLCADMREKIRKIHDKKKEFISFFTSFNSKIYKINKKTLLTEETPNQYILAEWDDTYPASYETRKREIANDVFIHQVLDDLEDIMKLKFIKKKKIFPLLMLGVSENAKYHKNTVHLFLLDEFSEKEINKFFIYPVHLDPGVEVAYKNKGSMTLRISQLKYMQVHPLKILHEGVVKKKFKDVQRFLLKHRKYDDTTRKSDFDESFYDLFRKKLMEKFPKYFK